MWSTGHTSCGTECTRGLTQGRGKHEAGLGEQVKGITKCFATHGAGHARGIPG